MMELESPPMTPDEEAMLYFQEELGELADRLSAPVPVLMDEGLADWVLNKLHSYKDELARRKIAFAAQTKMLNSKIAFFERRYHADLKAYALQQIAGTKKKSCNLPCGGKLKFVHVHTALKVADDDLLMKWAQTHCEDAIDYRAVLLKDIVNDHFKSHGEIPDGTYVVDAHDSFSLSY